MLTIRYAEDRGRGNHGWLDSRHTFSFASYYDPAHMGFRALRVINDDRVAGGAGFGAHPHRDMEIISYVVHGSLEHKDSMGTGSVIRPGEIQRMSAGTGVVHSEFNGSQTDEVRFLQIWIVPDRAGHAPGYQQEVIDPAARRDGLALIASPEGGPGAVSVNQDVRLYNGLLSPGAEVTHPPGPGRHTWIQVVNGEVEVNGERLRRGDGASTSDAEPLALVGVGEGAEVLVFDLG